MAAASGFGAPWKSVRAPLREISVDTRAVGGEKTEGPSHKPAASTLHLSGYQFAPHLVDLDGDGLKDLVVTGIAINPANTLRALTTGKVTAETLAFLNRWGEGQARYFRDEPDANVQSDIRVNVRFNYAGTLEVERSFTILPEADVDGDGLKDLLIRTSDEELTVRRGRAKSVWEAEGRTLKIPPRGASPDIEGYTADQDGDGKAEVVLLYRKPPNGKDRVFILRVS